MLWKEGQVKGLKARGNFEVGINWKNHRLTSATVKAIKGGICKLRTTVPVKAEGVNAKARRTKDGYVLAFPTQEEKLTRSQLFFIIFSFFT
jgi:alpha-L-fucosidase 2